MSSKRMFIVEDDFDIGEVIRFVLSGPSYDVSVYTTVQAFKLLSDKCSPT